MTNLAAELAAFRTEFMGKVPPEIRAAMESADADLLASDIGAKALKPGDTAPTFRLDNALGAPVALNELLASGPAVISFYRGGWCPYCNLELRALQRALPEIAALGATLVAISPQTPDNSLSTAEKNALAFPVLSDPANIVAKMFGITFDLGEELRPIYTKFGHGLPQMNGSDEWTLPIPATFVIGMDGIIQLAFVDTDYRRRVEPAQIVETLRTLVAA